MRHGEDDQHSTVRDLPTTRPGLAARLANAAGIGVLCVIVGAAAIGELGPTTDSGNAAAGGWRLDVTWPEVTRAGMPAPLSVEVTKAGGFDGPFTITLCADFFEDLDFQNWYPVPAAETATRDRLVYEFDPPPGESIRINLDARTAPGQFGEIEDCFVTIRDGGIDVLEVPFETRRMP